MTFHNPANVSNETIGPYHKLLTVDELDKPLPEKAECWSPRLKQWVKSWREGELPEQSVTYRIPLTLADRIRSRMEELQKSKRRVQELKVWPEFYEQVASNRKPFEIRLNDRDFREGDVLHLREYYPDTKVYSGQYCYREVTYLTDWRQKPNYVVMGLKQTPPFDNEAIDRQMEADAELLKVVEAVEKGAEWDFEPTSQKGTWCGCENFGGSFTIEQAIDNGCKVRLKPAPRTIPWTFETRPRDVVWVFKKGFLTDRLITAWKDDGVEIGEYEKPSYQDLHDHWQQRNGDPAGEKVTS